MCFAVVVESAFLCCLKYVCFFLFVFLMFKMALESRTRGRSLLVFFLHAITTVVRVRLRVLLESRLANAT